MVLTTLLLGGVTAAAATGKLTDFGVNVLASVASVVTERWRSHGSHALAQLARAARVEGWLPPNHDLARIERQSLATALLALHAALDAKDASFSPDERHWVYCFHGLCTKIDAQKGADALAGTAAFQRWCERVRTSIADHPAMQSYGSGMKGLALEEVALASPAGATSPLAEAVHQALQDWLAVEIKDHIATHSPTTVAPAVLAQWMTAREGFEYPQPTGKWSDFICRRSVGAWVRIPFLTAWSQCYLEYLAADPLAFNKWLIQELKDHSLQSAEVKSLLTVMIGNEALALAEWRTAATEQSLLLTEISQRLAEMLGLSRESFFQIHQQQIAAHGLLTALITGKLETAETLSRLMLAAQSNKSDHQTTHTALEEIKLLINRVLHLPQGTAWPLPVRAARFLGRESDFLAVYDLCRTHRLVAITGAGGMGKTALAAEVLAAFAPAANDPNPAGKRLYIHNYYSVSNHEAVLDSLLSQAGVDPPSIPPNQKPVRVTGLLSQPGTFLYLEGCERAEELASLLAITSSACVLLTTRDSIPPPDAVAWPLDPLSTEESAALIRHHAQRVARTPAPVGDYGPLAIFLGGHALACVQAGKVIASRGHGPDSLLQQMKDHGLSALPGLGRTEKERQHEHANLFYLLNCSLHDAEAESPGSADIWAVLSLGALAPLPFWVVEQSTVLPAPSIDQACDTLQRLGILFSLPFSPTDNPNLPREQPRGWVLSHGLVKTFGEHTIIPSPSQEDSVESSDLFTRWRNAWILFLHGAYRSGFAGGYPEYASIQPHLEALIHAAKLKDDPLSLVTWILRDEIGRAHHIYASYRLSEALHQENIDWCELPLNKGKDSGFLRSGSQGALAATLKEQGRYSDAMPVQLEALIWQKETLGVDNPFTLGSMNGLAALKYHLGDLTGAEEIYRLAFEGMHRMDPEDYDTLVTAANLGLCLADQGRHSEAEKIYLDILPAQERLFGHNDTATLRTLHNLSSLYVLMGKEHAAEPIIRRTIALRGDMIGISHPETISSVDQLGCIYHRLGKYEKAEHHYRNAYDSGRNKHGLEQPETLRALEGLAYAIRDQGRLEEAEELFTLYLITIENKLGREHPKAIYARQHIASIHRRRGEYAQAKELYSQALNGLETKVDKDDPYLIDVAWELGTLEEKADSFETALPLFQKVHDSQFRRLGRGHPETLDCLLHLIHCQLKTAKLSDALSYADGALNTTVEAYGVTGEATVQMAKLLRHLVMLLDQKGDISSAEKMLRQLIHYQNVALEPGHPDLLESIGNLGALVCDQGRLDEAELLFEQVFEAADLLGNHHTHILAAHNNLGILHGRRGDLSSAWKSFSRAVEGAKNQWPPEHPNRRNFERNLTDLERQLSTI